MTKYIDRYYLNGELYGIKFAEPGWQPGANTIAYYPLNSTTTVNDMSGNNKNLTNYNGVVFGTYQGIDCAYFDGNNFLLNSSAQNGTSRTLNAWIYVTDTSSVRGVICSGDNYQTNMFGIMVDGGTGCTTDRKSYDSRGVTAVANGWHNIIGTYTSGGDAILYIDGVQESSYSSFNISAGNGIGIGAKNESPYSERYIGYISNAIIEDKGRTAQEVSDYYNQTKDQYQSGWQPGANTIAYYPLESDLNDALGNYNATYSDGTVTYGQIGGSTIDAAFFDTTKCSTSLSTVANTINIWLYKPTDTNDPSPNSWKQLIGYNTGDPGDGIWLRGTDLNQSNGKFHMVVGNTFSSYDCGDVMDQWINLCCTTDGTTRKLYVNGQEVESASGDFGSSTGNLWFACIPWEVGTYGRPRLYLSHIVLESSTWSAQEVSDYYNQTKSLYGIS